MLIPKRWQLRQTVLEHGAGLNPRPPPLKGFTVLCGPSHNTAGLWLIGAAQGRDAGRGWWACCPEHRKGPQAKEQGLSVERKLSSEVRISRFTAKAGDCGEQQRSGF